MFWCTVIGWREKTPALRAGMDSADMTAPGVVINKDGKPVAALIGARLFERIRRMQTRFDALCKRIQACYARVTESEGMTEVDNAVAQSRVPQRRSRQ